MPPASHSRVRPQREPRRRHLRVVPAQPPPERCPGCGSPLDDWELELSRLTRRSPGCRACGLVLV